MIEALRQRVPAGKPALDGIRVVDLTQFEAGTSCTETLAWLGADVIKIEPPGRGEQGRGGSPNAQKAGADTPYFMTLNANKRSVTCNLKSDAGRKLLEELIATADVFIENFGPGTIERLGFGYEQVSAINPRIIYAQIKGFAPNGPHASYLAFDAIAQAAGGATSVTGERGGRPIKPGPNMADTGSGLHCTIGILAALFQRNATGRGQRVDVAMQDAIVNFGRIAFAAQEEFNKPAERSGNQSIIAASSPSEAYPCKGGGPNDYCFIYTTRAGNHHWHAVLDVVGRPDLKDDPRFADPLTRHKHHQAIDEIISAWTRQHDKREAMRLFAEAGIPASAVFDTVELSSDPALLERGTFVEFDHPVRGRFVMPGCMIKLSDSYVPVRLAPALGADNAGVYGGILGRTEAEIAKLHEDGAI